jgi:hypothetical protein
LRFGGVRSANVASRDLAGSAALLADEFDAAEERADAAEHGDRDGDPQRDYPQADRDHAHERHADPQQPVREPEDERLGLGVVEAEGDDQSDR